MSPQEENRIYTEMSAMNAKLDVLMPTVTELRGINHRLDKQNGSIEHHDRRIVDIEKITARLDSNQQWLMRIVMGVGMAAVGGLFTAVYAVIFK